MGFVYPSEVVTTYCVMTSFKSCRILRGLDCSISLEEPVILASLAIYGFISFLIQIFF